MFAELLPDGTWTHVFPHRYTTDWAAGHFGLFGHKANIQPVRVTVNEDGPLWGWLSAPNHPWLANRLSVFTTMEELTQAFQGRAHDMQDGQVVRVHVEAS